MARKTLPRSPLYTLLFLLLFTVAAVVLSGRFPMDVGDLWDSVRAADPGLYALGFIALYASLLIRGWRWRILINASAGPGETSPSVLVCTRLILIGRFADSVSFARVGNLYRSYLASHTQGGSFSRVLGTTAAESVLDMVLVFGAVLGVGTLLATQNSPAPAREAITAASAGAGLVVAVLAAMRRWGALAARRLPASLGRAYLQFHQGALSALGHRQLPLLFALTALGWLCSVARWYCVAAALGGSVSFPMVLFVSLANAVIAAIPATPGGVGLVEPGVGALLALEMEVEAAIAVTLSERFISYLSVVVIGGLLFLGLGAPRRWQFYDQ